MYQKYQNQCPLCQGFNDSCGFLLFKMTSSEITCFYIYKVPETEKVCYVLWLNKIAGMALCIAIVSPLKEISPIRRFGSCQYHFIHLLSLSCYNIFDSFPHTKYFLSFTVWFALVIKYFFQSECLHSISSYKLQICIWFDVDNKLWSFLQKIIMGVIRHRLQGWQ